MTLHPDKVEELRLEEEQEDKEEPFHEWRMNNETQLQDEFIQQFHVDEYYSYAKKMYEDDRE